MPFFKFENNNILNIYFLGDNYNLTTEDILSESNIKKLYEMGIKFLGSAMNNTSNKNEFAVTYQKGYNDIDVYGMALRKGQWKGVRMVRNERK